MVASIFGQVQQASGADVFRITSTTGIDNNQILGKALQRELDGLNGYKTNLSPAQSQKLAGLRDQITRLQESAGPEGLSVDQLDDRAKLYREANGILGKPYVDVEADPKLKSLVDEVDSLLETKYSGAKKQRLENLRSQEERFYAAYFKGNTSKTLAQQLANVKRQITSLAQPRPIAALSPAERRQYDSLVEKVNAKAGTEYLLPSRKRARAEALQKSIGSL